jgi:hypothetical protein
MDSLRFMFEVPPSVITGQIASLIHVVLASVVTVLVLKQRKELGFGVLITLLIVWLIPLIGPACIAWGLQRGPILKSPHQNPSI